MFPLIIYEVNEISTKNPLAFNIFRHRLAVRVNRGQNLRRQNDNKDEPGDLIRTYAVCTC